MALVKRTVFSPFTPAQMYRLVNDVPAYPSFLPWCQEAELLCSRGNLVHARLKVKKGRFDYEFTTENRLRANVGIDMRLIDGPFQKLNGQWFFESSDGGCSVTLELEFEFSGRILGTVLTAAFTPIADSMVEAFNRRAYTVYGD